ncbi:YciI family protein [Bacillus sp. E(2018)]|uniref:YciI family protein n=1 Tax=Bacillus sp. E(2018) TaxID=2502239 RepID=UPI0025704062|nr:YciI family protein [Bacillus sp. E(2018)]
MMMIFLCMGYYNPEKMDARPSAEIEAIMSECQPHIEKFYDSGEVMLDAGLDTEIKSLRRVDGRINVTDGPFTETKELIGSIFIFEAENMDEAIELASLHPTTQVSRGEEFGWRIEIRPVHYLKNEFK